MTPKRALAVAIVLIGMVIGSTGPSAQTADPVAPSLVQSLQWRNIGPFRGGRVTTVAGVPSNPLVYYMGGTGGGVWKTENAGLTWTNVSDAFFKTGSVGAIAVADSDPNVVFVGMGEAPVRGVATASGDGVYKSTDAGRTWSHVGLDASKHISRIVIHPTNPDLVYVAAQGSAWAATPDRGVYRSTDGGRTWTRVHHGDNDFSGASDLAMDPSNPRILYVAYWDHQRTPWQVRSGGPGSGIYKSTDGGDTWTKLADGLPTGTIGKIGIAVSPANPQRLYANVEADDGGVYRSEDGGRHWTRTTDDRITRARAWYYTAVTADPTNENVVYVINAPLLKSIDGGKTFTTMSAPHGDNHQLWINPHDSRNMIDCNDGGATISFDGGRTWSTQENQPTAQFYRVAVDDRFPYYLYGGQQDNTSVAIASASTASLTGGIDRSDWYAVGGCESAHVAFDPKDPSLVYANCYQGIITESDVRTKIERAIMPYPAQGLAEPSSEQKYRFNWNAPLAVSPENPKVIYFGGNVLFRSDNRGQTWTVISPDLTRNDKATQGLGGVPITNEGAGGEVYNTLFYIVESPHEAGTIWIGTDDGLVQLTRDGGKSWSNVTPPGIAKTQINAIEVSPHDKATAYVAATGYKWNDDAPHVFRTKDYGRTWTPINTGIRAGDFVRVVREDPVRRGLLYAGSETGAYVSWDDGAHWQSLQLNLPAVPVTDLKVHGADLVASTQGRAFWILDDITPLRQIDAEVAKAAAFLFAPARALRVEFPEHNGPATGKNPPSGAVVDYALAKAPAEKEIVALEILDGGGKTIRRFTSEERPKAAGPIPTVGGPAPEPRLPAKAGANRFVWDLRTGGLARVPGILPNGSTDGYTVAPGQYQVRLIAAGKTLTQPLTVAPDPRTPLAAADFADQQTLLASLSARIDEIARDVTRMRAAKDDVEAIVKRLSEASGDGGGAERPKADSASIVDAGKTLAGNIAKWEEQIVQPKRRTFQDVINFRNQLLDQYMFLRDSIDGNGPPVTDALKARVAELDARWTPLATALKGVQDQIAAFNTRLRDAGVNAVGDR